MNTFDLLIFSSYASWWSYIFGEQFTHCGIVLKSPTYLDSKLTGTYLLEASDDSIRITELNGLLSEFKGNVYMRRPLFIPEEEKMKVVYSKIFSKCLSVSPVIVNNCNIERASQPSAVVSYVYICLGVLEESHLWALNTVKSLMDAPEFLAPVKIK